MLNILRLLKHFIQTVLSEFKTISSNIVDRSDNAIARLKISNFLQHFNHKIGIADKINILSENLNDSSLHLNRHWKSKLAKLAMNLIKKFKKLRKGNSNRI